MALPTLEWLISDEQVFGLDDVEFSGQGLSADTSGKQCVNFLKFMERHILENSNYFEPIASAYDSTDGTLIIGLKAAPASGDQRLSGINFILGTSTNSSSMNTLGVQPHAAGGNDCRNAIFMTMTIGMANPATPAGVALNAADWKTLDWKDNAVVPYSNGTPRFIGYAAINSEMADAGIQSDYYGIRIIESAEALFFSIRRTPSSGCFLAGAGSIITPKDFDYAESPGVSSGWGDTQGAGDGYENKRLFGIMANGIWQNQPSTKIDADFWSLNNNSGSLFWSGFPSQSNNINWPVFAIYGPLELSSVAHAANRLTQYVVTKQYAGDLSTISGKRIHLDIPVKLLGNPYYFLGSLRQIRVGQDTVCGTILKDGSGTTKSILWAPSASVACNAIAFDNE